MSRKYNIEDKNKKAIDSTENSRNSKTGYMDTGNSSKIAARQGTRNKC